MWRDSSSTLTIADFASPLYKPAEPVIDLSLLRILHVARNLSAVTYSEPLEKTSIKISANFKCNCVMNYSFIIFSGKSC